MRSRVSALPSVEITDGVDARGLVLDGGVRVTGLSVRRRDGGSATTLDADPGRRRRRSRITVARWLADAGIAPPVAGSHTGSAPSTRTCRSSLSRAVATSSSRWLPDGYAVLGDAVCSLNSLYAQGMSMALREAALLGRIVDRHGTRGVGVAFLREATRWSTPPGRWRPARTSATRRSPGRGRSPGGCSISTSANLQRRTRGGGAGVSHDTNPRRCSRGTGYWR